MEDSYASDFTESYSGGDSQTPRAHVLPEASGVEVCQSAPPRERSTEEVAVGSCPPSPVLGGEEALHCPQVNHSYLPADYEQERSLPDSAASRGSASKESSRGALSSKGTADAGPRPPGTVNIGYRRSTVLHGNLVEQAEHRRKSSMMASRIQHLRPDWSLSAGPTEASAAKERYKDRIPPAPPEARTTMSENYAQRRLRTFKRRERQKALVHSSNLRQMHQRIVEASTPAGRRRCPLAGTSAEVLLFRPPRFSGQLYNESKEAEAFERVTSVSPSVPLRCCRPSSAPGMRRVGPTFLSCPYLELRARLVAEIAENEAWGEDDIRRVLQETRDRAEELSADLKLDVAKCYKAIACLEADLDISVEEAKRRTEDALAEQRQQVDAKRLVHGEQLRRFKRGLAASKRLAVPNSNCKEAERKDGSGTDPFRQSTPPSPAASSATSQRNPHSRRPCSAPGLRSTAPSSPKFPPASAVIHPRACC